MKTLNTALTCVSLLLLLGLPARAAKYPAALRAVMQDLDQEKQRLYEQTESMLRQKSSGVLTTQDRELLRETWVRLNELTQAEKNHMQELYAKTKTMTVERATIEINGLAETSLALLKQKQELEDGLAAMSPSRPRQEGHLGPYRNWSPQETKSPEAIRALQLQIRDFASQVRSLHERAIILAAKSYRVKRSGANDRYLKWMGASLAVIAVPMTVFLGGTFGALAIDSGRHLLGGAFREATTTVSAFLGLAIWEFLRGWPAQVFNSKNVPRFLTLSGRQARNLVQEAFLNPLRDAVLTSDMRLMPSDWERLARAACLANLATESASQAELASRSAEETRALEEHEAMRESLESEYVRSRLNQDR